MVTQATEHADELFRIRVKFMEIRIVEETLLSSDEALANQFVQRADREFDEASEVLP